MKRLNIRREKRCERQTRANKFPVVMSPQKSHDKWGGVSAKNDWEKGSTVEGKTMMVKK